MLAEKLYGDLWLGEFGDLDILIPEPALANARHLIDSLDYEFASPKLTLVALIGRVSTAATPVPLKATIAGLAVVLN